MAEAWTLDGNGLFIFFSCVQEDNPVYYNDFYMLTGTNQR